MKHILKAKKRFLCLLLAGALAACLSPAALAAPDGVEVAPGYDYTRFKDAGITLNVYNWGEYISNGTDGSMDVVKEFENLTGIRAQLHHLRHQREPVRQAEKRRRQLRRHHPQRLYDRQNGRRGHAGGA